MFNGRFTRVCVYRYVYYNATDASPVANSNALLLNLTVNSNSCESTIQSGLIELNVGLASNRVYNVLYENVAYCLVAFLVPLTTLAAFKSPISSHPTSLHLNWTGWSPPYSSVRKK